MVLNFSTLQNRLHVEHGVDFKPCPVGAHYMHGKVERKIQQIKKSICRVKQLPTVHHALGNSGFSNR